ncbi:MAG: hypothetical protein A3F83_09210 [Candidatus Glassbacteria bacterium RIFCSPLOWO2_12_FULL_58_11]|uniref:UDP-N-acetylmuramoyl-tripeptide--D-alanyl-D-alanine ligase n=1 Tax=Candidatus Glassbacteria bacterium RIFCSPLOWO2_12_FULL_58_11 TaxID=1817867 RepID=A0A1F5Z3D8_9BACT|nr:MAG: hypothetical protein A3F83_09210 [Candidatus Glassbacteria bacterium RIFCSPLOWO2_12_FULL_58_11]
MELSTREILSSLDAVEPGGSRGEIIYRGVSTDTRADCRGKLFVALAGESFDANAFLNEAAAAGAAGALIGPSAGGCPQPESLQYFRVPDTLAALHRLAALARRRCPGCRAVAVTGSNGKSTTKELCAAIARIKFSTHATAGNLNNHIGLPLTLLGLEPHTQVLVAEIGANHPGEIRPLARLAAPEISVITNIAPVHLEGFGSLEGVLAAKLELFEETLATGHCVYCGDNSLLGARVPGAFRNTISFGLKEDNALSARDIVLDSAAHPSFTIPGLTRVKLSLAGRHNVLNALAAAAVGRLLGLAAEDIRQGLEALKPLKMRGELKRLGGLLVLDDCYNANPLSMREALKTLEAISHKGSRAAVLGEMLELGAEAEKLHLELAAETAKRNLRLLVLVGAYAARMKDAYLKAGGAEKAIHTAEDAEEACEILKTTLEGDELLLVKGSRGVHLERVVKFLEKVPA